MRTFILTLLLALCTIVTACATEEEEYELVIPDSTDGPDEVVVKDLNSDFITHCRELQDLHYVQSFAWQTYHNDTWLGDAYQHCQNWGANMTQSCKDEANEWMYWSSRRVWANVPPPGHWYGDYLNWTGANGWPVLKTPNDTGVLRDAYYACDPLY